MQSDVKKALRQSIAAGLEEVINGAVVRYWLEDMGGVKLDGDSAKAFERGLHDVFKNFDVDALMEFVLELSRQ